MAELAGTNSIEYYLKGRALRQNREAQEAQAIARQQKMQQDLQIAKERQSEVERWHQMQNEINLGKADRDKLNIKLRQAEYKSEIFGKVAAAAKAIQLGEMELVDPNQGFTLADPETGQEVFNYQNLRPTAKGTAASQRIEETVNKATALSPITAQTAGAVAQAQVPAKSILANIQAELQSKNREDTQAFTAEQNALNRAARASEAANRLALAREKLTATQVDETENDEAIIAQIRNGEFTNEKLNSLPTKDRKRINIKLAFNKEKAFTVKELEKLNEINSLNAYIDKSQQLHEKLKGKTVASAMVDGEIQTLTGELDSLAKTFAVNVAGDRSILSEREIPRIREGVVQRNPAGYRALNPFEMTATKVNAPANERRLREFRETYDRRIKELLGSISPAERKALSEKFNIRDYSKQTELKNKQKPKAYGPQNPPPANLKRVE